MAKIWLALLLVATLGSVDPVASEITVVNVKDAWKTFKPDTVPDEITNCDGLTCNSALVDPNASDLNTLCTAIDTYSSCAKERCSSTLTDAQKQELQKTEDLCKTADLEAAMTDIKGNCDKCDTQAGAVDSATGLDAKCLASLSFIECVATQTDCSSVPPAHVEALKEIVFGNAMTAIKGECDNSKCVSTTVDSASGINDKCLASFTYIDCVVKAKKATTCDSVDDADVDALKTLCKGIPLFDFGVALVDIKENCDCESTDVDSASALDGKCLASLSYIDCVKKAKTTTCTSVDALEVEALKTPCKDKSIPLYDFGSALNDIKENCDCESTDVEAASGLDDKCLASLSYIECVGEAKATTCTSVDAADVDALKTPCNDGSSSLYDFGIALIDIKENCPGGKCESTAVDGAAGLDKKCLESESYLGCVNASCPSVPDDDKEALKTACKASTLDSDDDGCSILQVSTLALMLSLLLSLI